MGLTKSFRELVQRRVSQDPEFTAALLHEGIDTMLSGDIDTGKAILRDYIQVVRLSVEDQRAFAETILNPPPLTPAMERAIERYRKLVAASVG